MIRIMDDTMTLVIGKCAVPTARFSEHAAADGDGVWSFPLTRPGCSPRPGDHGVDARRAPRRRLRRRRPLVRAWHEELFLWLIGSSGS